MKGLTVKTDNVAKVVAGINALLGIQVLVGIPGETAQRQPEPGAQYAPMNNPTIGYLMETGSPAANIPARPFLIPGVRNAQERITNQMQKAAQAALDGHPERVMSAFEKAGIIASTSVKNEITNGEFVPLAPTTLAARRARGVTRVKPLVDTGQLRNSVTYVVRKV